MQIKTLISDFAPCDEGRIWLEENEIKTVAEAYDKCERSDWLVWLLVNVHKIDKKQRVDLSCRIVRTIWNLLKDESKHAIVVAEKYVKGEATEEELNIYSAFADASAADAAAAYAAAYAADPAYSAAAAAAAYAAAAAAAAADDAAAAAAAAFAADAAAAFAAADADAFAAADADAFAADAAAAFAASAFAAARQDQEKKQCKIVRKMFPNPF